MHMHGDVSTTSPAMPIRDEEATPERFLLHVEHTGDTVNCEDHPNVRTARRVHPCSSLRRLHWFVLPFCLSTSALALPPLVTAVDIAQPGLTAYLKPGELWLGIPDEAGRPGLRPLVDLKPRPLPSSLSDFTTLGTECQAEPLDQAEFGGTPITARVAGDALHPVIQIERNERLIARSLLGRPATVCALHIAQADAVPGPELIVSWQMGNIRGFTVYRVPESLDPTAPKP